MPYLPDGIYHKMRRNCEKAGVKLITKPGTKLRNILCTHNKTHHKKINHLQQLIIARKPLPGLQSPESHPSKASLDRVQSFSFKYIIYKN